jgi:hypothetical protein
LVKTAHTGLAIGKSVVDSLRRWIVAISTIAFVFLFALAISVPAEAAASGRRVALVIGNATYDHVESLANPANDSREMREKLGGLGFEIFGGDNLTRTQFLDLIARFKTAAQQADTAVVYYSGHGFQLRGLNYLVPRDAELKSPDAIATQTIRLDDLISGIEGPDRQTLVFLDACRNNPLPPGQRKDDGLAQVETGNGVFVAFATQPGNISYDGRTTLSPFTKAISSHIGTLGQSVSDMMIKVRNDVERMTLYQQTPWDQSSLRKQVYMNGVAPHQPERSVAALDLTQQPGNELSGAQRSTEMEAGAPDSGLIVMPNVVPGAPPSVILLPEAPIEIFGKEDLVYAVQTEMGRIGCYDGEPDGVWGGDSRDALVRYYQTKKLRLQDTEPTEFHLGNLRREQGTVCAPPPAAAPYKPRTVERAKPGPREKPRPAITRQRAEPERRQASRPVQQRPRKEQNAASAPKRARSAARVKPRSPAAAPEPPANSLENSRVLGSFR